MENCLVSKLEAEVNNPSLKKLGCIIFTIAPNTGVVALGVFTNVTATWTIEGPAHFTNSSGIEDNGKTIQTPTMGYIKFDSASETENAYLTINKKYNVTKIEMYYMQAHYNEYVTFDLNDFAYNSNMVTINLKRRPDATGGGTLPVMNGSMDTWQPMPLLQACECPTTIVNVDGFNFATGNSITLIDLSFANGSIYNLFSKFNVKATTKYVANMKNLEGTLDHAVVAQRALGNTTGSFLTLANGVLVGAESLSTTVKYMYIEWTSNTIVVKCSSTESSYLPNNVSKIFCNGFTDEEIAEKTASGGEWEGIDVSKFTIIPV